MSQPAAPAQAKKLTPAQEEELKQFTDRTCMLPSIVRDGIVDEVGQLLKDDPEINEIWEHLRNDDILYSIELRSGGCFVHNKKFRANMLVKDPRPAYNMYMRHWIGAEMFVSYPAQYEKLPESFKKGLPPDIA